MQSRKFFAMKSYLAEGLVRFLSGMFFSLLVSVSILLFRESSYSILLYHISRS